MTESEKTKRKAKHGENQGRFSASTTINLIVLAFFALSVMTSHQSFGVLPAPSFFHFGGIVCALFLLYYPVFAFMATKPSDIIALVLIALSLALICLPFLFFVFSFSVLAALFVYKPLEIVPVIIFPLLLILSILLYRFSRPVSKVIPLAGLRIFSVVILWLAAFYIWGQAAIFEGYYEEGLEIEGKNYHSVLDIGWLSDYGYLRLYECHMGVFFCTELLEEFVSPYQVDRSSLVYDEASRVLKLEYHSRPETFDDHIPDILFEYPIP
jgi:hypothetical protein